ncbi:MAG: Xaa-Pro aminopeptidase [Bacteroidetes bacterium GWC2_33_15]|nr:MAG: Xaa-Pro aminopeptidase [Bacteroidetes bacterium GWA2_33_15]OFX48966.1 MAG: Xaa-Pro aminopeptidase [Bacteroidetes bacterium GWC2_33_15]OFX64770.1 MAG: Xaa-Pro aminopeptidase [Bacteroidetes bacterium GWB2_32_14]OFX68472.1 MAG: Xaa-Pro aminopeptidase [Bacteroidetes bacterium GWD2_33_33]HAN19196.1 Xaa-Pro aminopeptidase [Bacteroidales bacterium]
MFKKEVYSERRNRLKNKIKSGLILFMGNQESAFNYPDNTYHFRQDSSFLYFFGLDLPNLAGLIDLDSGKEYLFGNDFTIDDIIWMGKQPEIKELAAEIGIEYTEPLDHLGNFLRNANNQERIIHVLPFYRGDTIIQFCNLLQINHTEAENFISVDLIKAVVELRSIKDKYEVEELIKAAAIGYKMHVTSMKMAKPGIIEQEIAGVIEGISLSYGASLSFPIILSQNGETLHNHFHGNILEEGRLLLTDTGAETNMHYASDNTRTCPVGGKFSQKQKDIYSIVLSGINHGISLTKPGVTYQSIHLEVAKVLAKGLTELGLMKGNPEDAVREGAHAMFMPHGLGHMMGLDVHDMENLGEDYVGYDNEIKRATQFGLRGLRLGRRLQPGFVLTNEPGIYFIPDLIQKWKAEKINSSFINYDKVLNEYSGFGGIRLEDDILVTETGHQIIGKRIPITIDEVEETMRS